jgi:hypothetical protein
MVRSSNIGGSVSPGVDDIEPAQDRAPRTGVPLRGAFGGPFLPGEAPSIIRSGCEGAC